AAYEGASEVGGALLASTTTTLVIFAPMIFISGIVGQMFAQLAVVMIVTVSASLFVALTLTPTLSARVLRETEDKAKTVWWEHRYLAILKTSLKRPWMTIIGASFVAVCTFTSLLFLSSDFLPKDDMGLLSYTVELPVGATKEESLRVGNIYANELRKQPEVQSVSVLVGSSANGGMGAKEGNNIARIRSRLVSARYRERSDGDIGKEVLKNLGSIPEVVNLEMSREGSGSGAMGATKPIIVEILGNDLDELQKAAIMIQDGISKIEGTTNVVADLFQTKPELQIQIDRYRGTKQNIPVAAAGQEVRLAMTDTTISRYTGGSRPRDIVFGFQKEDKKSLNAWKKIPIRMGDGRITEMGMIAEQREGASPIQIRRKDKARLLSVSLELSDRALTAVAEDVENMLSELVLPNGVQTQIAGAIKEQRESFGDLGLLMAMGLALVYLVMVAQFESWTDPFVIMFSVPFAATGAFLALIVTGTNLSVTSFLGLIILIGVVVNNAIVLIDYIKLKRTEGMELLDAIHYAGQRRLRPVLITSLTTAGGMLPLALTKGEGEQLWGPMGKTALGGLLISSVITLVLVPTLYYIIERFKIRSKRP
ncbi:MAG: efflux RND transporter permease subunit, partial [Myxococcota bacterium]|nr:efflux RND transporter permease subunit [Myxococcota bacterium]